MLNKKINSILLVNPSYSSDTYLNIDRSAGTLQHPIISLASIAGALKGICEVNILDFDVVKGDHSRILKDQISDLKPDIIGITATTPMFPNLLKIASSIKEISKEILIVAGGVHATTYPQDVLASEYIDIAVIGEGDFFLRDFVQSKDRLKLKGAYFKQGGRYIFNGKQELISDLDLLPYPYWELYDLSKYKASRMVERHSPGGLLETSRGCPFLCSYCNKKTFGTLWRKKSIERVITEFKNMKKLGFKEIHIEDDGFTTDINRAKAICKGLIESRVNIPWTLLNGIRVDRVDEELFGIFKKAGCYQVAFGIESGDDEVLKRINKGITVKQVEKAVNLANNAGLETFGFFMLGLIGETEQTMRKTINLSQKLPLTIAKFTITIPYPGTPMFEELEKTGAILHKNWKEYLAHNNKTPIFKHLNLRWDIIQRYYKKAHFGFYFRPVQFYKQLFLSIKNKTLIEKIIYLFKTKWF